MTKAPLGDSIGKSTWKADITAAMLGAGAQTLRGAGPRDLTIAWTASKFHRLRLPEIGEIVLVVAPDGVTHRVYGASHRIYCQEAVCLALDNLDRPPDLDDWVPLAITEKRFAATLLDCADCATSLTRKTNQQDVPTRRHSIKIGRATRKLDTG